MSIMHNGEKVLNNLTTVPITQTINASSTEKEIPSAKAVFGSIDNIQTSLTSLTPVTDLDNFKGKSFMIGRGTGYNNECANVPNGITGAFVVEYFPYGIGDIYGTQRITLVQASGGKYSTFERSLDNGNWMGWQKVCTTKVADVPKTEITFSNTSIYAPAAALYNYYEVKDGVCYVSLYVNCNNASTGPLTVINESLPIPKRKEYKTLSAWNNATDNIRCVVEENGRLSLRLGTSGGQYIETFTYKVAE